MLQEHQLLVKFINEKQLPRPSGRGLNHIMERL